MFQGYTFALTGEGGYLATWSFFEASLEPVERPSGACPKRGVSKVLTLSPDRLPFVSLVWLQLGNHPTTIIIDDSTVHPGRTMSLAKVGGSFRKGA